MLLSVILSGEINLWENLSKDMKMRFPVAKGYSVRNLKYMKKFAQIFTEDDVDEYGLEGLLGVIIRY